MAGHRSADPALKYPRRMRPLNADRAWRAFTAPNDKLFPQRRFGVMVSGGPAMAVVELIHTLATDYQIGNSDRGFNLSVGALLRIPIDGGASFQPEMQFSHLRTINGTQFRNTPTDKSIFSFNSVRMPLMIRYNNIGSASDWMLYLEAGPEFSLNFGGYTWNRIDVDPADGRFVVGERTLTRYSVPATGVVAGAGIERYIDSRQAAWFGVRYSVSTNALYAGEHKYFLHRIEAVAAFSIFNF
jgi:hypothetical protein